MPAKLYVVHGSHPCATAEKALELKGVAFTRVELPPPAHAVVMPRLFGGRTVPGIRFEDGGKVQGSTQIMRDLDRRVPRPALFTGPEVEEAEAWGEGTLQPIARRLLWQAFARHPGSMYAYQQGQRAPKLPDALLRGGAPLLTRIEKRMNRASDDAARADVRALPGHLDRVDAWIADGRLNGDAPTAADLQIAPTLRLLHTIGDLRPVIAGRPAEAFTFRWFDPLPGSVPAGVLPPEWLPGGVP